jgi:hypothetical protein
MKFHSCTGKDIFWFLPVSHLPTKNSGIVNLMKNAQHAWVTTYLCRISLIWSSVPSAPADIKAVTSGDSSAIVSWRAPALSNGVIQKYTVYRREIISGKEAIHFPYLATVHWLAGWLLRAGYYLATI